MTPRPKTAAAFGRCLSCRIPLLEKGGFHGTDLCGPCCTGEARTAGMLSADDPCGDDEYDDLDGSDILDHGGNGGDR